MTPFFIALQFLTRLKIVNQTEWSVEDFGKSVVAFPYVGLGPISIMLVCGAHGFFWAICGTSAEMVSFCIRSVTRT